MNQPEYPTPWQRKVIWRALTALAISMIFSIVIGFIYILSGTLDFLQPILVPFAVAGVLAYLLEPLVARLVNFGTTRTRAVWAVFIVTTLAFVGFLFWLIPVVSTQTGRLASSVPQMTYKVRVGVANFAKEVREKYGLRLLPDEMLEVPQPKKSPTPGTPNGEAKSKSTNIVPSENPENKPGLDAAPSFENAEKSVPPNPAPTPNKNTALTPQPPQPETPEEILTKITSGDWVHDALPAIFRNVWGFFSTSLGGFLGFFGFLLSMVIVPLYLFYLLTEFPNISKSWSDYLPLRASAFKDEVVECLTEINGYLIAFFRGQLVVSLINGFATGTLLAAAGLDFGILIGFALCFLGIIPYLGIILCWIPAVIIASVQGTDSWLVPATASWWVFPLIVTGIFSFVQQVDGLFITPKIVGERVGLHPATVIFSVFLWSLLLGGLLGAILAVPLTATFKVLLRRYIWERKIKSGIAYSPHPAISEK